MNIIHTSSTSSIKYVEMHALAIVQSWVHESLALQIGGAPPVIETVIIKFHVLVDHVEREEVHDSFAFLGSGSSLVIA